MRVDRQRARVLPVALLMGATPLAVGCVNDPGLHLCKRTVVEAYDATVPDGRTPVVLRARLTAEDGTPMPGFGLGFWGVTVDDNGDGGSEVLAGGSGTDADGVATGTIRKARNLPFKGDRLVGFGAEFDPIGTWDDGETYCRARDTATVTIEGEADTGTTNPGEPDASKPPEQ